MATIATRIIPVTVTMTTTMTMSTVTGAGAQRARPAAHGMIDAAAAAMNLGRQFITAGDNRTSVFLQAPHGRQFINA